MPDMSDLPMAAAVRPDDQAQDQVATPRRRGAAVRTLWVLGLLLLLVVAVYGWYRWTPGTVAAPAVPVAINSDNLSAEVDSVRRSLDDAARINRALREQVLGLTQRVGLLEDGLAGVERGAAPGVDSARLAEADFVLRLAEERLRLFGDVEGARTAFQLADGQLAEVSDPRATSVRQTLALERDALAAVAVADLPVILGRLDGLAAAVERWPLKSRNADAAPAAVGSPTWWTRFSGAMDRYFRVRRVDPAERASGGPLLRERLALDLSRARLLLVRGEGKAARSALDSVRALVYGEFDERDNGVAAAVSILDEVRSAPLQPQLPALGEARRELARLRGVTPVNADPDVTSSAADDSILTPKAHNDSSVGTAEAPSDAGISTPETVPDAPNSDAVIPDVPATDPVPADQGA